MASGPTLHSVILEPMNCEEVVKREPVLKRPRARNKRDPGACRDKHLGHFDRNRIIFRVPNMVNDDSQISPQLRPTKCL